MKLNLNVTILAIAAFILLFVFLSSPNPESRVRTEFNLFVLGSVGWMVLLEYRKQGTIFYEIRDTKDLINDSAVGFLAGIVTIAFVLFVLGIYGVSVNLFGSVSPVQVPVLTFEDQIFLQFIQPLTETIVIIGLVRFLSQLLKNVPIAILLTFVIFGIYHFSAFGTASYPYSFSGIVSYLTSSTNAINVMALGLILIVQSLTFKSGIVPLVSHIIYNTYTVATGWTGWLEPIVLFTFLFFIGLTVIVYSKNKLSELKTFDINGLVKNGG